MCVKERENTSYIQHYEVMNAVDMSFRGSITSSECKYYPYHERDEEKVYHKIIVLKIFQEASCAITPSFFVNKV